MSSPADPHPRRRMSRRRIRRLTATLTVLALLLAGGYTAAAALTPLPAPIIEAEAEAEPQRTFEADPAAAQAAVDAEALPTAVGWLHDDEVWSNSDAAIPIASISKLVTVLVALEQQPLEAGEEGPVHVWTAADRALQEEYVARQGVAFPIPVGTEVTTRQMLTLALVPSANDFAAAYAYSIFGDNDGFIAAVDDWKARHGLDSLELVEPTGMDERNAATASDVLRIARIALRQPAIAEITRLSSAELPWGIGLVESTNPLFGVTPGILGAKTGYTNVAGYNLAAARASGASGRELVQLSVVLGRPSPEDRVFSSLAALDALDSAPQAVELVAEGEEIGAAVTVDGVRIPLVTTAAASAVLVPGEAATRIAELEPPGEGAAGQAAGAVRVETPVGAEEIPVVTTEAIVEPDLWWRLTHPALVFGWEEPVDPATRSARAG